MERIKRLKHLTKLLNEARDSYYNNSIEKMSDKDYDDLFDELSILEKETGVVLNNSPTQTVGYEVKSKLTKVVHNHAMLSLDKTKSVSDIVDFLDGREGIAMLKMDGLTCSNGYKMCELYSSETRGNGEIGEDILSNSKTIKNLPLRINIDSLIVDGEVIIDYGAFNKINDSLVDTDKYKNPRNLASGSIRQLDSKIAANRNMKFVAWKSVKGIDNNSHCERLNQLEKLGFEVVPFVNIYNIKSKQLMEEKIEEVIEYLKNKAKELEYPIDGIVFGYDDISYGESLGATGHHLRSQIAYKFYDDLSETVLLDIEYNTSRNGVLTPVAIFEPVEIDGTEVSRASLHNLSIIEDLQLGIGDTITVYKANAIIPQVKDNITRSNSITPPNNCPVCGGNTVIKQDNNTKVLTCNNPNCRAKLVAKLSHFASKHAMNIDGLSEATLEFLVNEGWVEDFLDLYFLEDHKTEWMQSEGFGVSSVTKLLNAIEESKNVKLENFLYAQGIPNVGKDASKKISKLVNGDFDKFMDLIGEWYSFDSIDGIGSVINSSIYEWCKIFGYYEGDRFLTLVGMMNFTRDIVVQSNSKTLENKAICITGKLIKYPNRDTLVKDIELNGGKVVSGVTKLTNYLLTNDVTSGSSKNKKAAELGIPIITEEQFIEMIK